VTFWIHEGLVTRSGNVLVTTLDTLVVAGVGYDGSGPDGDVPNDGEWAYLTDIVTVRLSEPTATGGEDDRRGEVFDRATNRFVYRARRVAAATHDGCRQFGIHVALPACG
jgi:hypothetical protein